MWGLFTDLTCGDATVLAPPSVCIVACPCYFALWSVTAGFSFVGDMFRNMTAVSLQRGPSLSDMPWSQRFWRQPGANWWIGQSADWADWNKSVRGPPWPFWVLFRAGSLVSGALTELVLVDSLAAYRTLGPQKECLGTTTLGRNLRKRQKMAAILPLRRACFPLLGSSSATWPPFLAALPWLAGLEGRAMGCSSSIQAQAEWGGSERSGPGISLGVFGHRIQRNIHLLQELGDLFVLQREAKGHRRKPLGHTRPAPSSPTSLIFWHKLAMAGCTPCRKDEPGSVPKSFLGGPRPLKTLGMDARYLTPCVKCLVLGGGTFQDTNHDIGGA